MKSPLGGDGPPSIQAFPLNGGTPIQIGNGLGHVGWSLDGRSVLITGSYLIPLKPDEDLPPIPAGAFHSRDEVGRLPGVHSTDAAALFWTIRGWLYAFYKGTVQRNLYRIPIL